MAAGAIGPTHLRVIAAAMGRIPDGIHPETAAQAEQTLARAARRFDPAALGTIAERLLAHLDPDGPEPVEEPETMRELRVRTGTDGVVSLTGKLDPEGGARVLKVLGSLNARRPPVEGVLDTRSQSRRDADALVEAMTRLLDEGELPTRGGQRPHLVLTMGLNDLIDGLGSAALDTGGHLSAAEARCLACDATIIPMVLGSDSMPLDVGRHQRLATAALRDALAHRDQGCAFPACQRAPRYCHAHHIVSWLDGGETKISNLGLVYRRQGRYRQAAEHHQQALTLFRELGDRSGEAYALDNLGTVYWRQGHYEQAGEHHQQALILFRELGDRAGEAYALNGVGEILYATDHPEQARAQHTAALTLTSQIGDRYQQARAHNGLARTHHATGDTDWARHHWHQALALYTDLSVPDVDDVHAHLTALDQAMDHDKED